MNNVGRHLIVLFICLLSFHSWSQENDKRMKLISVEVGIDGVGGHLPEYDYIRAETSTYYGEPSKNLSAMMFKSHISVKTELRSMDKKSGLSVGLRFTRINSTLGTTFYSDKDFFYLMLQQSETSIDYLKVVEIAQASNYLGIPIDISYYPFSHNSFPLYFKAGVEFDYRLGTTTTIRFVDSSMGLFGPSVLDKLNQTNDFVTTIGTRAGLELKKNNKIFFAFEMGPLGFLNKNTSSIYLAEWGFGAACNVRIRI